MRYVGKLADTVVPLKVSSPKAKMHFPGVHRHRAREEVNEPGSHFCTSR